jgi:hypothetical protein
LFLFTCYIEQASAGLSFLRCWGEKGMGSGGGGGDSVQKSGKETFFYFSTLDLVLKKNYSIRLLIKNKKNFALQCDKIDFAEKIYGVFCFLSFYLLFNAKYCTFEVGFMLR